MHSPPRPSQSTESPRRPRPAARRGGFTLIELLVVTSILAIVATMTFAAYTFTLDSDRISGASRQIQSYLAGARDRAIHAREPRGVRFLLDDTIPETVSSMVFVGAPEKFSNGGIQIDDNLNVLNTPAIEPWTIIFSTTAPPSPDWASLTARGLLTDGARLKVTSGSLDAYFHLAWDPNAPDPVTAIPGAWKVTRDPNDPATFPWNTDLEYELTLEPAVLANQEPRLLAKEVLIDLEPSRTAGKLPSSWYDTIGSVYVQKNMTVMFSPRGTVIGDAASLGMVHLILADRLDITNNHAPGSVNKEGDEAIVTLTPQTGSVTTHEVNPDPADIFFYAETGGVSK